MITHQAGFLLLESSTVIHKLSKGSRSLDLRHPKAVSLFATPKPKMAVASGLLVSDQQPALSRGGGGWLVVAFITLLGAAQGVLLNPSSH